MPIMSCLEYDNRSHFYKEIEIPRIEIRPLQITSGLTCTDNKIFQFTSETLLHSLGDLIGGETFRDIFVVCRLIYHSTYRDLSNLSNVRQASLCYQNHDKM